MSSCTRSAEQMPKSADLLGFSTRPERFELPTFGSVDHFWGSAWCRRLPAI
jgi:hypothetical protein